MLPRRGRSPVRHLHSRHDPRHPSPSRQVSATNTVTNSGRPQRKPLPLHRLHAHLQRRPAGSHDRTRRIMRSNVTQYDLVAPNSLDAVLQILADSPDHYTPIAGGTELMVALGAGRLQPKKLISLWNLEELRFIEDTPDAIIIGAGTTFTDIRKHPVIAREFSILGRAASWTGSIAQTNPGTPGGQP